MSKKLGKIIVKTLIAIEVIEANGYKYFPMFCGDTVSAVKNGTKFEAVWPVELVKKIGLTKEYHERLKQEFKIRLNKNLAAVTITKGEHANKRAFVTSSTTDEFGTGKIFQLIDTNGDKLWNGNLSNFPETFLNFKY